MNRSDNLGQLSKLATAGLIVGAVICVAAISILSCGVGTATLAGAIAVGASQGAIIGAGVGVVAGAGIGYAATGKVSGALEGAAIGLGGGALVGAIIGGTATGLTYGTFSSSTALTEHFAKHGIEFGKLYSNASEYAKGAKYVIKNGQYVKELNGFVRFIGTQGKANYAFVGMKAGGRVATYGVRSVASMIAKGVSMFTK